MTQPELEDLSAYLDGELETARAEQVRQLIETDSAWARAYAGMRALDQAIGTFAAPPPAADLAQRIIARARREGSGRVIRFVRWAAPVAAAAALAVAVAVWATHRGEPANLADNNAQAPRVDPHVDAFAQQMTGMLQSKDVVSNFDTLAAMDSTTPPTTAPAAGGQASDGNPSTIARQLALKIRIMELSSEPLAVALSHSRQDWPQLPAEQRENIRREAYAFLQKDAAEQAKLIEYYRQFTEMSSERQAAYRERARWLPVVVGSFTPAQREQLRQLTPDERSKLLLERKAALEQSGKLPTTQPVDK